jgi:hypothetical protein
MLLSAAIIVRNEAAHLDACLTSIAGLVDEIVVIDTGSTDDSVAVARRHGAAVALDPWQNDFARARNRSLDTATGEWILYVDADERVRCDTKQTRAWLAAADDCVGATVRFVPRVGWTPYREYRLWRNRADVRFEGAMHESIVPAVHRAADRDALRIVACDLLTIEHLGYEGDQSRKHERDEPMLRAEIERVPERTYLYDHLARVYEARGDAQRAVTTWHRGIAVARARGRTRPDDLLVYVNLIVHLQANGEAGPEVGEVLDEALALFPGTPSLELAAARYEFATEKYDRASRRAERLIAFDTAAARDSNSYDLRIFNEWAWELLGLCRFAVGEHAAAADAFSRAEAAAPSVMEYGVRRRLAEIRAKQ